MQARRKTQLELPKRSQASRWSVFAQTALASVGLSLLAGLSMRKDHLSPKGLSIGLPLEVLVWALGIAVACVTYGFIRHAKLQALLGYASGIFVGFFLALGVVMANTSTGIQADKMTAQISPYNHTAEYIHQLYVNDQGGGNSRAYSGGGSFVCCLVYPKIWREGLTAKVRWTTSSSDPNATGDAATGKWHEKIVPIDRYSEPGTTLNVHFLPKGEVRLVISSKGADHPQYQGPKAPEKPKDFPF
jgi:hypothetical protein